MTHLQDVSRRHGITERSQAGKKTKWLKQLLRQFKYKLTRCVMRQHGKTEGELWFTRAFVQRSHTWHPPEHHVTCPILSLHSCRAAPATLACQASVFSVLGLEFWSMYSQDYAICNEDVEKKKERKREGGRKNLCLTFSSRCQNSVDVQRNTKSFAVNCEQ